MVARPQPHVEPKPRKVAHTHQSPSLNVFSDQQSSRKVPDPSFLTKAGGFIEARGAIREGPLSPLKVFLTPAYCGEDEEDEDEEGDDDEEEEEGGSALFSTGAANPGADVDRSGAFPATLS
jgi:hypothetical protein